jgi:hypothetical protein
MFIPPFTASFRRKSGMMNGMELMTLSAESGPLSPYFDDLPELTDLWNQPFFRNNEILFLTGAVAGIILGLALLMRGEKLFRLWMVLTGLWSGWQAGVIVSRLLQLRTPSRWLVPIALAIAAASLFVFLFRVAFILAGFAAAAFLGWKFLIPFLPLETARIACLVCGLLGAILAGTVKDFFIRSATAMSGAWLFVNGLWQLLPTEVARSWFGEISDPRHPIFIILNLLVILLGVGGYFIQVG